MSVIATYNVQAWQFSIYTISLASLDFTIIQWCQALLVGKLFAHANLAKDLNDLLPAKFVRPKHWSSSVGASHVRDEWVGNEIFFQLGNVVVVDESPQLAGVRSVMPILSLL